jgi:OOP family OmpA-OmpF porin
LRYDADRKPWFVRGDVDWYDRDAWYLGVAVGRHFGSRADTRPRVTVVPEPQPEPEPVAPTDSDGDGVMDTDDQCPNTPRGSIVDASGCPVPVDTDEDGVLDDDDECPGTAPGVTVDPRGCEVGAEIRLQGVKFETNSDVLLTNAAILIEDAARTLVKNPSLRVEVAGYTDDRGDAAYNQGLSERRAKTVRDYLVTIGVDEDRLTWRGYGENDPIADNATPEGREQNRRVVLRIIDR